MKEYTEHIDKYVDYAYSSFSRTTPKEKWGDRVLAKKYLQKYWLVEQEYVRDWKPIEDKIFIPKRRYPNLIYHSSFVMTALIGGCLFVEEDFSLLQKVMIELGNTYFVVIQHSQGFTTGEPMFRIKYPVNITWEELMSGNYISSVLFEMPYNEYCVFSESGNWGKYAANDYIHPLDILGYKPELAPIFEKHFKLPDEERATVKEWLPEVYKPLLKL